MMAVMFTGPLGMSAKRMRSLPSITLPPTAIGSSDPQTTRIPSGSQTERKCGSISNHDSCSLSGNAGTSKNNTSGDSITNRAVYPVGDQLAGTMAVDLSEPEPPLPLGPLPDGPLPLCDPLGPLPDPPELWSPLGGGSLPLPDVLADPEEPDEPEEPDD